MPNSTSNPSTHPVIIQGGMGIGVSGWRLARAVSQLGQLGVVSGTAIDTVMIRRLQDGDEGTVTCRDLWASDTLDNYREVSDGSLQRIMAVEMQGRTMDMSIVIRSEKLRGPIRVVYRYERESFK